MNFALIKKMYIILYNKIEKAIEIEILTFLYLKISCFVYLNGKGQPIAINSCQLLYYKPIVCVSAVQLQPIVI